MSQENKMGVMPINKLLISQSLHSFVSRSLYRLIRFQRHIHMPLTVVVDAILDAGANEKRTVLR